MKSLRMTGLLGSLLWFGSISAQQSDSNTLVPVDLPNEAAITAYQQYQQRAAYSAFAISPEGGFGSAWSFGLISAADEEAINNCQQQGPKTPCMVVSRDGKSIQQTLSVGQLMARFEQARRQTWPAVEDSKVPVPIARNSEQVKAYREYTRLTGHKAFAFSPDGSFGVASGQLNDAQAHHQALQDCAGHVRGGKNCAVVDSNNQSLMGLISVVIPDSDSSLAETEPAPFAPPLLQSDKRDKERAKALFGERWQEYQDAERHKAYAINQYGASGMAKEHATSMVAEEAALSSCEAYNLLSGRQPEKIAPCFIIAVNNFYDVDAITQMEAGMQSVNSPAESLQE